MVSCAHERQRMVPGHLEGDCHVARFASNKRLRNDKCSFLIIWVSLVGTKGGIPWILTRSQKGILPPDIHGGKGSQRGGRSVRGRHTPTCGLQPPGHLLLAPCPRCYLLPLRNAESRGKQRCWWEGPVVGKPTWFRRKHWQFQAQNKA